MKPAAIQVRVLIVDDSEDDAAQLLNELRRSGYQPEFERIETAPALRAALTQGAWDVVFAKTGVPQLDALEALRLVHELDLDLPFVAMAAAMDEEAAREWLNAGAHLVVRQGHLAPLGPDLARELRAAQERRERRRAKSGRVAHEQWFRALLEHSPDGLWLLADDYRLTYAGPTTPRLLGYSSEAVLGLNLISLIHPDDAPALRARLDLLALAPLEVVATEFRVRHSEGAWRRVEATFTNLLARPDVAAIVMNYRDVTERRQGQDRLRLMDEVLQRIQSLVVVMDESGAVTFVNQASRTILGYEPAELLGHQWWQAAYDSPSQAMAERDQIAALARGQLPASSEAVERAIKTRSGQTRWVLWQGVPGPGNTLIAIGHDITTHKQAEEQMRAQLSRLAALRNIDLAVTGSLDRNLVLDILLKEALTELEADAASVLLYNPETHYLEQPVRRGFYTAALQYTRLRIGQGLAGRAALERRPVSIADLATVPDLLAQAPLLAREGFVAYQGLPLIAKGQVKGVLEVFHRKPFNPSEDWLNFVAVLAGQAAIAIENAELFVNLQRSNAELVMAYDATIEGWSRALDLRDHDTEGHAQRVTELTLRLARALDVPEAELVHIRRGALLHDIGKLAVPDAILLKPGPLTESEMALMRQHPTFAYALLSPVRYLRPALDIPYGHHENWDGTGYPRGLRGDEIPLAARIFAVADVWEALRSSRPYRPAWPEGQVRAHIQASAGTHFDPRIVDAFFKLQRLP